MYYRIILVFVYIFYVSGSGIYHENTVMTFTPMGAAELFGYSVALTDNGLVVGAPRAINSEEQTSLKSSGLVFNCSLHNLDAAISECNPMNQRSQLRRFGYNSDSVFKDDMWFGATIASLPGNKLMICSPRFTEPYGPKHLLAHGLCSVKRTDRDGFFHIYPLGEKGRQAFQTDGKRPEYGEYGIHLNFYAYGQAGMSIKAVNNDTVLIGAPGLLQWTGGIVYYTYNSNSRTTYFSKQVIANPYYTYDLGPDDYFGYSVEAGVFSKVAKTYFVGGAPRSMKGYGQVLVFSPPTREESSLRVYSKVQGPQLGAYFGASLCCLDLNGDGYSDLLVGAPNYVTKDGGLPYDQGAVFVYLTNTTLELPRFINLEEAGHVMGSGASGARFGTTIADLGDIDGDGYRDVAIAAPWEDQGTGVVYIYRGYAKGLRSHYVQRITALRTRGFGFSISQGYDVDGNNCNDLAIGAFMSSTVFLYRCVPTMRVHASIRVPDAMNLPHNATGFNALFCVTAQSTSLWPHVKTEFNTRIVIDAEDNRASISEESQFKVSLGPGEERCDEQTVDVKPTADLSKPISMKFFLEPNELLKKDSKVFNSQAARVSEDSVLETSFLIQLVRDCGEDMICTPWLLMTWELLDPPHFTPGTKTRLGARLTIHNKEEPAYGAKVNITLPLIPKRLPSPCSLEDLVMTCDVPAPLFRNEEVAWDIELEYKDSNDTVLKMTAELDDPLYNRNITDESIKEVELEITREAVFDIAGKSAPNNPVAVSRDKFNNAEDVTFSHYIEISNFGPSNWYLEGSISLPKEVNLVTPIRGCEELNATELECAWFVSAKVSLSVILPLRLDLAKHGEQLQRNTTINITTEVTLTNIVEGNKTVQVTTTLILDPPAPLWPLILGIVAGLVLLAAIVYLMHRYGFFSRHQRERLKELKEQSQPLTLSEVGSSTGPPSIEGDADESTQELLFDSD